MYVHWSLCACVGFVYWSLCMCVGFVRHLLKSGAYTQCLLQADRLNLEAKGNISPYYTVPGAQNEKQTFASHFALLTRL